MHSTFEGKVAVVTGGTSGIGLATAAELIKEGCFVFIIGNSANESLAAIKYLDAIKPGYCIAKTADLSTPQVCNEVLAEIYHEFNKLHILINSAGIYFEKSILETSEIEFDTMMGINLKATYFMCKYAIPYLKANAPASIVNVSSDAGINGNFFCTAYCASKGAVTVFTKALSLEMASCKIRVNCVCPGDVNTPMLEKELRKASQPEQYLKDLTSHYPLERIAEPYEVAKVIAFLASENASFVTGAAWGVDGGITAY